MVRGTHPTKERLIDTMVTLLDQKGADHISVDEVLNTSGISKGSLYHHFEDFSDLLEAAYIRRFSAFVDATAIAMADVVARATNREELLLALEEVTRSTNSPELAPLRLERIRAIGLAGGNERFARRLAVEQQRLTDAFTDLIREAQVKEWIAPAFSPEVLAVFIQAYTFGRVLDEIAERHVDPEEWYRLVHHLVATRF